VLDFGKTDDGHLFVVSERLAGRTLEEIINHEGPMALERAKKIVAQIGDALLEGQKVGVVHRDLAPKNVFLVDADSVKVFNFVVARPALDHVFGVPAYLSPEQAEGKLVDQRSNTYGLAAIFYFLLTGVPPFAGGTVRETLDAVLRGELLSPSVRQPGVSADVDRVVNKAMDKTSSKRPLTLRQFLNDVAALSLTGVASPATHSPVSTDQGKSPFSQTMVFGAGAKDVQQLVQQALAARAGGGAASATPPPGSPGQAKAPSATVPTSLVTPPPQPFSAPVASAHQQATPPPVVGPDSGRGSRPHGAAVAATMVAMPASGGRMPGAPIPGAAAPASPLSGSSRSAQTPAPAPDALAAAPVKPGSSPNNFRETLWFKKGDVDQMVAEAKAKIGAAGAAAAAGKKPTTDPALPAVAAGEPTEEAKPLEDRYLDDGTVTADDRKKFSLRTGGTSTSLPVVGGQVPGDRMSDTEMLNEMGGKRKLIIAAVVAAVILAVVAVLAVSMRGKNKGAASSGPAPPTAQSSAEEAAKPFVNAPEPSPPEPAAPTVPNPTPPSAIAPEAAAEPSGPEPKTKAKHKTPPKKKAAQKTAQGKRHH
jgi:flagellar basal body-associated protein FliL